LEALSIINKIRHRGGHPLLAEMPDGAPGHSWDCPVYNALNPVLGAQLTSPSAFSLIGAAVDREYITSDEGRVLCRWIDEFDGHSRG
jgi:hypothetical protein